MTRICNFPISEDARCTKSIADDYPNCGEHGCGVSSDQLGQNPITYHKNDELHVWAEEPNDVYCLIHRDAACQVLYQVAGEKLPCCLKETLVWRDEHRDYHRDDGPAVILTNGTRFWCQHGKLHRDDGPAMIFLYGKQVWYQNGEIHRDDGPALIKPDGTRECWQHGELKEVESA